jgi:hypothetical protein
MQYIQPKPLKEHLLGIKESHAVTPIDAERVRKLQPASTDASQSLNPFRY